MGFQVTAPTAIPVDGDGSQDQLTWADGPPGALLVPSAEGAGFGGAVVFTANDVDYVWRQGGRWARSTANRTVLSDEGLFSSCVVKLGTFNIAGGTLDVTLTPTMVVVDADNDGGVKLEIKAAVGSPETLQASRDTYLNLNEAGAFELQVVPTDDPPPIPTAGYVSIWVLVTDGTELTAANLVDGIAGFPCFGPLVGARSMLIEVPILGGKAADAVTVTGTMTCAEVATFDAGIKGTGTAAVTLTEGAILPANESVLGDATTTMQTGTMTALVDLVALGQATTTDGYEGVAGTAAKLPQGAVYSVSATPSIQGQTAFNSAGEALHHNGDHVRAPGARASARQEAATGAAQVTTTMQTGKRQTAPVSLDVTVNIYVQRSVAGTVSMTVEEDNGIDGGGQIWSTLGNAFVTPQLAASFLLVQFTRVRTADATDRYFRLRADSGGGTTQVMQEGHLEVRPLD